MALVSFKNFYIWPTNGQKMVHMPIFWYTFRHNSAIVGLIWLIIFIMRNLSFDAYFSFLIGKWSWLPRAPLTVKCLQTRPNNWHTGWNFWANHHIEIMFLKFSEVNPLNLLTCLIKSESHNRKANTADSVTRQNCQIPELIRPSNCFAQQICLY